MLSLYLDPPLFCLLLLCLLSSTEDLDKVENMWEIKSNYIFLFNASHLAVAVAIVAFLMRASLSTAIASLFREVVTFEFLLCHLR